MKYVVNKPIAWGGRKDKGDIVEMSENDAKNIGVPEYLAPEQPEVSVDEDGNAPAVNLEDMTVEQLKSKASDMGLKVSGSKATLIERITLAEDTPVESEEGENEEETEDEEA